jgi:putative hydrolase of the HAD superfamily
MQGIVFDLDETLIDRNRAVTNFAELLWAEFFSDGAESEESFIERVHHLDGHGYTPREQFFELMWDKFSDAVPSRSVIEETFYEQVWETPQLAEGVIDCLSRLQRHRIPLAIVTNGSTRAQEAKIKHSGIRDFFSAIVVSEAFGVKKPDPSIYEEAASKLKAAPDDCWFVGDHPVNDVWGSKQVGYHSAWIHLDRPWASELSRCYDVKGATFVETMSQVMEAI